MTYKRKSGRLAWCINVGDAMVCGLWRWYRRHSLKENLAVQLSRWTDYSQHAIYYSFVTSSRIDLLIVLLTTSWRPSCFTDNCRKSIDLPKASTLGSTFSSSLQYTGLTCEFKLYQRSPVEDYLSGHYRQVWLCLIYWLEHELGALYDRVTNSNFYQERAILAVHRALNGLSLTILAHL